MVQPVSVLLVAATAGSGCCELPLKATAEDEEEIKEVTVSLAEAKETSVDAAVARGLSELDIFSGLKKNRKACVALARV